MLTLNGVNTYTGGTKLVDGTLALYGRLASGVQIGSNTRLAGTGTITGDVFNQGVIQPQINGQTSTLTIIGNYSGDNAIFASTLAGTAPNAIVADQLAIVGAGSMASGSTTIAVSDPSGVLGQPTVGDGILLVGFSDGATGTDTAFRSDRIAAGAYEYQLVRGGQSSAEDWYLRADNNTPAPPKPITPQTAQREEVALYPVLPTLVRQYLMSITGTLDERRGAPDNLPKERVAWARVIAQNNETNPPNANDGPGLKANDWGLQMGADLVRADLDAGHWRMGPVITIGRSTGQAYNNSGSFNTGSVSLNGYSLGLNATLAMENGAYLDVLVQGTRLTGVSANSPLGTSIQTTGWGLSGSVEGGWRLGLSDTVSLTPQAQLYGVHTQLADSGDLYSRIEMPNASMLVGRVGLKIAYDSDPKLGPKTQLWARVSALSTLSGRDASTSFLNVAGTNPTVFQSQAPATWMSLDAGIVVNATPNTQINIGLGYQTSFNGQFTGISGQINARIGF
jgi:outer membrane autotransporter protein